MQKHPGTCKAVQTFRKKKEGARGRCADWEGGHVYSFRLKSQHRSSSARRGGQQWDGLRKYRRQRDVRGKQGSFVIFRRGAECAPRERSPGWGGGTRACIFDAAGSTVHGPAPEGTSRTGQKSAFDGKEISGRLYPNANLRAAWTGCSRTENRAKESVQVLNRF